MCTWGLIAVAVGVVICEIVSGHQRAETDNKIDEIHRWLKRCHPYKFNGYDSNKIEYRNNKEKQQTESNDED